jgi:peptidoglycan hydrolase CwlO-like protein
MNEINDAKRDIQKKLKSIEEDIHKSPVVVENAEIRIKKSQSKFLLFAHNKHLTTFYALLNESNIFGKKICIMFIVCMTNV